MAKGRPTKFSDAIKDTMLSLYKSGKTDKEVADIIGVEERTINNWKGKHKDFFHALKESKNVADDIVLASLFNRATGGDGYRPDTTAQIFWLKNRQPKEWRRSEMEVSVKNISDLTDEQLDEKIVRLQKELSAQRKKD